MQICIWGCGFTIVYSCLKSCVPRYPGCSAHTDFLGVLTLVFHPIALLELLPLPSLLSPHIIATLHTYFVELCGSSGDCVSSILSHAGEQAGTSSHPILVSNLSFFSLSTPICSTCCLGFLLSSVVMPSYIFIAVFLYNSCINFFG